MATVLTDWFCELCTLQFDKKIVFDLHLKLVHDIEEKKAQLCTENLINTNDLTTANLDFTEVPISSSTIELSSCLHPENSISTNNSTPFERKDKNNVPDIWVPNHEKYAAATCAKATISIIEVLESSAVKSSTLLSVFKLSKCLYQLGHH